MLRDAKRLGWYLLCGAVLGASVGYLARHLLDDDVLLLIGFWIFVLSPVVLLVCARRSFGMTVLCVGSAVFMGVICAAIIVRPSQVADKKSVMAYVDSIKPSLEDFRSKHGHYPDKLAEVDVPAAPWGFEYKRELDTLPTNPDTYRIDYGGLEYWSGSGQWFDDD